MRLISLVLVLVSLITGCDVYQYPSLNQDMFSSVSFAIKANTYSMGKPCGHSIAENIIRIEKITRNPGTPIRICQSEFDIDIKPMQILPNRYFQIKVDLNYILKSHIGSHAASPNTKPDEYGIYSDNINISISSDIGAYLLGSIGGYDPTKDERHSAFIFDIPSAIAGHTINKLTIEYSNHYAQSARYDDTNMPPLLIPNEFFEKSPFIQINSIQIIENPEK